MGGARLEKKHSAQFKAKITTVLFQASPAGDLLQDRTPPNWWWFSKVSHSFNLGFFRIGNLCWNSLLEKSGRKYLVLLIVSKKNKACLPAPYPLNNVRIPTSQ